MASSWGRSLQMPGVDDVPHVREPFLQVEWGRLCSRPFMCPEQQASGTQALLPSPYDMLSLERGEEEEEPG